MMSIDKPALLIHVLFAADAIARPESPARLAFDTLWKGAAELGIEQPLRGLPDKLEAPASLTEMYRVLRALKGGKPGAIEEAIAIQTHDTVIFSLILAPNRPETSWRSLEETWNKASGDIAAPGTLGSVTLYLGLSTENKENAATLAQRWLPDPVTGCWSSIGTTFPDGQTVWELPTTTTTTHRRLLALAPPDAEDTLDRWLWTSPTAQLVPFTRYLIHATKLRHASATLMRDLDRLP